MTKQIPEQSECDDQHHSHDRAADSIPSSFGVRIAGKRVLAAEFEGIASGADQANDGVQREHATKLRCVRYWAFNSPSALTVSCPNRIMHVKLRAARSNPIRLPRDLP
jgi:hypothetical protein